jgi:predicted nucleotidyltransferase
MSTSLSNALFSGVQGKVLGLLFGQPDRSFYRSEIIRNIDSGTGAVERELERLQQSGLVSVEQIGSQKHYQANQQSPIFEELQGIVLKTVGLAEPLKRALKPYANQIKFAFVYGSVAKGTDTAKSDIDLMVISDELSYSDLYDVLHKAEKILRRMVNPTIFSIEEWNNRIAQESPFITKVNAQSKIFIFGSEADLESNE